MLFTLTCLSAVFMNRPPPPRTPTRTQTFHWHKPTGQGLTLRLWSVRCVHLHAVASYGWPGGAGEVSEGRAALTAPPELQGLVVVLREDGPPAAAWPGVTDEIRCICQRRKDKRFLLWFDLRTGFEGTAENFSQCEKHVNADEEFDLKLKYYIKPLKYFFIAKNYLRNSNRKKIHITIVKMPQCAKP